MTEAAAERKALASALAACFLIGLLAFEPLLSRGPAAEFPENSTDLNPKTNEKWGLPRINTWNANGGKQEFRWSSWIALAIQLLIIPGNSTSLPGHANSVCLSFDSLWSAQFTLRIRAVKA